DGNFRVIGLEVRTSPPGPAWESYAHTRALARALRAGGRVRAVEIEPADGAGRVIVRMRGSRFVIDHADFEHGPTECPC
ncbi:MAG TPA: hypothetical protein VL172_09475, partial [Kofleriaceae bacterium]|nr:hypothetical protein [Kofleriaceae bacterium]